MLIGWMAWVGARISRGGEFRLRAVIDGLSMMERLPWSIFPDFGRDSR